MAKNKQVLAEWRGQITSELKHILKTKKEELGKKKLKHKLGQLKETHGLGLLRSEIARLQTLLSERGEAQ